MIRLRSVIVFGFVLWMGIATAGGAGAGDAGTGGVDPTLRQRLEQLHRLAQQMVEHGRHGHTAEIVKYADEMIRQTEPLVAVVGAADAAVVRPQKQWAMLQAALQSAMKQATAAARLGETGNPRAAMAAARQAAFQIKHARMQWEAAE